MKLFKNLRLSALAALSAMGIFFALALQYSLENSQPLQPDGKLEVYFLDVGQGDATLIVCDGEAMLIDAGENDKGTLVQNHLMAAGIDSLRYMIGTHPDSDHIGGMDV
ncbi:MAG: MBL fold metallo-hydrolase, partial [Lachnospiraceae bacterium]|nr:MBL fold metallo-hydrolase [Lachnospiraceae bacterium]